MFEYFSDLPHVAVEGGRPLETHRLTRVVETVLAILHGVNVQQDGQAICIGPRLKKDMCKDEKLSQSRDLNMSSRTTTTTEFNSSTISSTLVRSESCIMVTGRAIHSKQSVAAVVFSCLLAAALTVNGFSAPRPIVTTPSIVGTRNPLHASKSEY